MFLAKELEKGGLLDKLTSAHGPTGYEGEVRNIIKKEIENYVDDIKVDKMGNIVAHKKGNGPKIMIAAHMDEVGFIITGYNKDGTLKFRGLGGVNQLAIPSKPVLIGEKKLKGVIGAKAIHLQNAEERKKPFNYSNCCIDIGAKSKDEAMQKVEYGEYAVFDTEYDSFGENLIKGKAFDDRIGCLVIMEILKEKYNCDLYGIFNVQEEVGSRGANISAFNVQPDLAIVLEGTICADMPNIPDNKKATEVNKGPAISIMDKKSIFSNDMVDEIIKCCDENKIPYQRRASIAGGNDAGVIHTVGNGTSKIAAISVPCRYIHSSISVASQKDYLNTVKLLNYYLKKF